LQVVGEWFLVARLTGHFSEVSAGRALIHKVDDDTFEIHYAAAV
jgi:hypothetical protein